MSCRPLLLLLLLPACTAWKSQDHVLISSEPLGARIKLDGLDTGRTTPAKLDIGGNFGRDHTIVIEKKGYRPASRRLYQYTEGYTSKLMDGVANESLPPLPIFWTFGDFLAPFGIRGALLPAELHVRLEREDAPKLGFELLAAKAAEAKTH